MSGPARVDGQACRSGAEYAMVPGSKSTKNTGTSHVGGHFKTEYDIIKGGRGKENSELQ
jgi:hypothetical protein